MKNTNLYLMIYKKSILGGGALNLKQLKYFLAVAEEKQVTAAAKRLHIAQPPLSYQLKELEKDLDVKLFKRTAKGVILTEAGKMLTDYARQIVDLTQVTEEKVRKANQGQIGTISLGLISSSGGFMASVALADFQARYPDVSYEIYEDNTYGIIEKLHQGQLDLAIVRTPFNQRGLKLNYLTKEKMVVVSANDYSPQLPTSFTLTDLEEYPLIIYRRFKNIFTDSFEHYGIKPNVLMECDDARTALYWAEMKLGLALVPESIAKLARNCRIIPVDYPAWETQMALIWLKGKELRPILKEFISVIKEGWK